MAERRMFTKKITDSDSFTALPPTTQAFYFHLCMDADDDGFNNKIRQAMFNAHADQNDFNLLVQQRFILPFESGVIVIKHWKMHNIIRNDRYHETEYLEEKATLLLKKNGAYTECDNQMSTKCQPNDSQMEPEVRLGKDRLGKDRLGKVRGVGEGQKAQSAVKKTTNTFDVESEIEKLGISDFLADNIREWIDYKRTEKKFSYKQKSGEALVKQIVEYANTYGEEGVVECINNSICNGYSGLFFDKLTKGGSRQTSKPQLNGLSADDWLNA